MSQLICPVFGDLMLYGVAAMGWLFILGLIANAWWERRQARLMRLQAIGQSHPKRPARTFFQKWRRRFLLVAAISVVIGILVRTHKESADQGQISDNSTPLETYAAHYEGKLPFTIPTAGGSVERILTNLWNETVLHAKTLDLAVDTNLFNGDSNNLNAFGVVATNGESNSIEPFLKTTHDSLNPH